MARGEHAVLDGTDSVDAPLIVGDALGELALDGSLRVEAVGNFFGERATGGHVFAGEDDYPRGEAVPEGIEAGALLGHDCCDLRPVCSTRETGWSVKVLILLGKLVVDE